MPRASPELSKNQAYPAARCICISARKKTCSRQYSRLKQVSGFAGSIGICRKCIASPVERILALFDLMQNWFKSEDFYGCVFINAVAEHDKGNSWIQEIANRHGEKINARLQAMVAQSGIQDPELVTKKLSLLIDGTIVTAMVTGNGEVAHIGRLTAEDILRSAPCTNNQATKMHSI